MACNGEFPIVRFYKVTFNANIRIFNEHMKSVVKLQQIYTTLFSIPFTLGVISNRPQVGFCFTSEGE